MSDPDAVKRALARLAAGDADDAAVVRAACDAVGDVERTAAFVDRVGVERLATATDAVGDTDLTRQGQRALAAVEWYRRAATPDPTRHDRTDHFRSGRGTVLQGEGQESGR